MSEGPHSKQRCWRVRAAPAALPRSPARDRSGPARPSRRSGDLLEPIKRDRVWFDAIVERVPPERLDEPGLPGGWSAKDVLAHIAWGRHEAAGAARARALVGSDLWDLPQDERNAIEREQSRARSVEEILRDYRESRAGLLSELEAMTDDELNDPGRMKDLAQTIPGWRPWRVLYDPGN